MTTKYVSADVTIRLEFNDKGDAALQRYVDLSPEKGKEMSTTPGLTRKQVELSLIQSALYTGRDDASTMDGWADLERGDLMIYIDHIEEGY